MLNRRRGRLLSAGAVLLCIVPVLWGDTAAGMRAIKKTMRPPIANGRRPRTKAEPKPNTISECCT